jgi:hypothetical protein
MFDHNAITASQGMLLAGVLAVGILASVAAAQAPAPAAKPVAAGTPVPYLPNRFSRRAQAGVSLVVPQMEKVGQLRQASENLEAGKSYWMAFSNAGRRVKRGDRVNVVIGNFQAQGLVVE